MTRIDVDVREDYIAPPLPYKGWRVDAYFAAVRIENRWQIVHLKTGLRTRWTRRMQCAQAVQFGQAATKKFGARVLNQNDIHKLIASLRRAGSVSWSKRRFAQVCR